jgi:hypothetical protein
MQPIETMDLLFEVGALHGRCQAFASIAARCSAALAQYLRETRESKQYRASGLNWRQYCRQRVGISKATVDRIIRLDEELGPNYYKFNSCVPINPREYRLIAAAITDNGVSYQGAIISLDPENAAKLAPIVQALRRESAQQTAASPSAEQALAKAEKSLETSLRQLERIQAVALDPESRLRFLIAIEAGLDRLDRIRKTTDL